MKGYKYVLYLIASTALLMVSVELLSSYILKSKGLDSPVFFASTTNDQIQGRDGQDGEAFNTIDPHLGYTHGPEEKKVALLSSKYTWSNGFLIYSKNISSLPRPIILALGGSTTDGVNYGHSWPEHLADILRQNNYSGTVINGGIGGYSTNQELFKLVRDGLEFEPDIVISYGGINDRGFYSVLPYPMVHTYQVALLRMIMGLGPKPSPVFPSTVALIEFYLQQKTKKNNVDFTLGLPTSRSLAQNYERNMELMNAISGAMGAKFYAFIQPFAFYRSRHSRNFIKPASYVRSVQYLYDEITKLPARHDYIRDATQILEDVDDVYRDGTHLTNKGDHVVAQYVFKSIEPNLLKATEDAPQTNVLAK